MTVLQQRYRATRVVFLLAILFCLCTSRGEGLHLLPFAADTAAATFESLVGEELPGAYQLAKAPEDRIFAAVQSSDHADNSADPGFCPFSFGCDADRYVVTGLLPSKLYGPQVLPTKFRLTASSDRSPPIS